MALGVEVGVDAAPAVAIKSSSKAEDVVDVGSAGPEEVAAVAVAGDDESAAAAAAAAVAAGEVDSDPLATCSARVAEALGAEEFEVVCPDACKLVSFVRPSKSGSGKVMLLFAPLGQSDLSSYLPIIAELGDEYTYVSWQYRGFFRSDLPPRSRRVSIRDHAEDALHVLRGAGFSHADVVVGHSKGVQVALEFVLLYPECASALILMNGSHGTVFNQAFQPFTRLPFAGAIAEMLVDKLISLDPSYVVGGLRAVVESAPMTSALRLFGRHGAKRWGGHRWLDIAGEDYLPTVMGGYFAGITENAHSSLNWLRGFQELHAHSVKHLLPSVEHPTMLLSGRLDYLTPSWVMDSMQRAMPNAEHKSDWWSTHFSIVENPDFIVDNVSAFLKERPAQFRRNSSTSFEHLAASEVAAAGAGAGAGSSEQ